MSLPAPELHVVHCRLCSGYYSDPRVLPCLHSFCCGCLRKVIEAVPPDDEGRSITCPMCQEDTPLLDNEGANDFPRNLHLAREVGRAKLVDQLTSSGELYCDGCAPAAHSPPTAGPRNPDSPASEKDCSGAAEPGKDFGGDTSERPAHGSVAVEAFASRAKAFCCHCRELMCQLCWDHHRHHRRFHDHHVIILGDNVAAQVMSRHPYWDVVTCGEVGHEGELLAFYCSTCSDVVCYRCKMGGPHREHCYEDVTKVAGKWREKMSKVLESAGALEKEIVKAMEECGSVMEMVEHNKAKVASMINGAFDDLQRALTERRTSLLAKLEEIVLSKSEAIKLHAEALGRMRRNVCECRDQVGAVHGAFSDEEVATLGGIFPDRLQSIVKDIKSIGIKSPSTKVHSGIATSIDTSALMTSIQQLGVVADIDPAKCTWTYSKLPLIVNVESMLEVQLRTSEGMKCQFDDVHVEARMRSEDKKTVTGVVITIDDGTYTITLTPPTFGIYQLQVTVNGQHTHNSPCRVHVVHDYQSLKRTDVSFSCTVYKSNSINYMTIYGDSIYLSECHRSNSGNNYCYVGVYSLNGKCKQTIRNFINPHGIAIKGDVMYVADTGGDRIQKLTISGEFLLNFGQQLLKRPQIIALSSDNNILVANDTSEILVFLPDGSAAKSIKCTKPEDCLNSLNIYDIMVDSQGDIHVAACDMKCILVYSPEGRYIRRYGQYNSSRVKLSKDMNGCSVVCCDGSLLVFDMFGKEVPCSLVRDVWRWSSECVHVAVDRFGNMYTSSSFAVTKWSTS